MKIIFNDYSGNEDIEICECLEPQGAFYCIQQGENVINFANTTQVKETIKVLNFLLNYTEE